MSTSNAPNSSSSNSRTTDRLRSGGGGVVQGDNDAVDVAEASAVKAPKRARDDTPPSAAGSTDSPSIHHDSAARRRHQPQAASPAPAPAPAPASSTMPRVRLVDLPGEIIAKIAFYTALTPIGSGSDASSQPASTARSDALAMLLQLSANAYAPLTASSQWTASSRKGKERQRDPIAFLPVPRHLPALMQTCSRFHSLLSPDANPALYTRLFRFFYDTEAIERRYGPQAVQSPALAAEYKRRAQRISQIYSKTARKSQRTRSPHQRDRDSQDDMLANLWTIYLLILENDGRNSLVLDWIGALPYLDYLASQPGLPLFRKSSEYPPNTTEVALGLHIRRLLEPLPSTAQAKDDLIFKLRPFLFAAHKFDACYAPWTDDHLPLGPAARAYHEEDDEFDFAEPRERRNPYVADLVPRDQVYSLPYCGGVLHVRPPNAYQAASQIFFHLTEEDPDSELAGMAEAWADDEDADTGSDGNDGAVTDADAPVASNSYDAVEEQTMYRRTEGNQHNVEQTAPSSPSRSPSNEGSPSLLDEHGACALVAEALRDALDRGEITLQELFDTVKAAVGTGTSQVRSTAAATAVAAAAVAAASFQKACSVEARTESRPTGDSSALSSTLASSSTSSASTTHGNGAASDPALAAIAIAASQPIENEGLLPAATLTLANLLAELDVPRRGSLSTADQLNDATSPGTREGNATSADSEPVTIPDAVDAFAHAGEALETLGINEPATLASALMNAVALLRGEHDVATMAIQATTDRQNAQRRSDLRALASSVNRRAGPVGLEAVKGQAVSTANESGSGGPTHHNLFNQSALHDIDLRRLTACLSPFSSPGLPPLLFHGSLAGTWHGKFAFFDFDAYRAFLAGRIEGLFEGQYGEQEQVWKLEEKVVRVRRARVELDRGREALRRWRGGWDGGLGANEEEEDGSDVDDRQASGRTSNALGGEDDDDDDDSEEVEEIAVSGVGHSAWGHFVLQGRVRAWDGLVTLVKEYRPDGRGRWRYRGYLVADENLVGRWRDTFSPPHMVGYEGCFLLHRREAASVRGASVLNA